VLWSISTVDAVQKKAHITTESRQFFVLLCAAIAIPLVDL
jgi:hypothetical protein